MTYDEYYRLQTEDYLSFESENHTWADGQREFINAAVAGLPLDASILDAACGDGVGLAHLDSLGFYRICGIDISQEKLARARKVNTWVVECSLEGCASNATSIGLVGFGFDCIISSHTLEHTFDPAGALTALGKMVRPTQILGHRFVYPGRLAVALPFVDVGPRDAHCASDFFQLRQPDPEKVLNVFRNAGFSVSSYTLAAPRGEPEIQLFMTKP